MKKVSISLLVITALVNCLTAQTLAELKGKYDHGVMSLSYGTVVELKTALKENAIASQVQFVSTNTPFANSGFVLLTLRKLKILIEENTVVGQGPSFSFINLHLADSLLFYKRVEDNGFIITRAAFTKPEVVCLAFFIDKFRLANVVKRVRYSAALKKETPDLQVCWKELKEHEQDPFASEQSITSMKYEFSEAVALRADLLQAIPAEERASIMAMVSETREKSILIPHKFNYTVDTNLLSLKAMYKGSDLRTRQIIRQFIEGSEKIQVQVNKQVEIAKKLEMAGLILISTKQEN